MDIATVGSLTSIFGGGRWMDMQTDLYKCWKVREETRVALTPLVPSVVQEELAVDCCAEFAPCCSSVLNNLHVHVTLLRMFMGCLGLVVSFELTTVAISILRSSVFRRNRVTSRKSRPDESAESS